MTKIAEIKMRECFPQVTALDMEPDEILIRLDNYPLCSTMCLPTEVAVELATKIMCIANKQMKEAA